MYKFDFVNKPELQEKLRETHNYIEFLLDLKSNPLDPDIWISINRDIIIHTVSILEGLITFLLLTVQKKWTQRQKQIISKTCSKDEYKLIKVSKDISIQKWDTKVVFCTVKNSTWKVNWKWWFWSLIDLLTKLKVFDDSLISHLKDIRDIRNDIHPQRILDKELSEITDKKMLELFNLILEVESEIEDYLKTI